MDKIITDLITLSTVFKEGFTVEIKNGKINQYSKIKTPYIVSVKTLIEINKTIIFKSVDIPKNCIIGGWLDKDTNIYYIELNEAFKYHFMASESCEKHKQKAYYDISTNKVILSYREA